MSFQKLLREAAKHFTTSGYTSQSDINHWRVRLLTAAEQHLDPEGARETIRRTLGKAFFKAIGEGRVAKRHGSVHKFTIDRLEPKLKDELERRMYAAQELLDGDKRATLERIHNRFLGLATAGANPGEAQAAASAIGKAARDSRAQERMVAVDQTKKMVATLDEIIAKDGGFNWRLLGCDLGHRPQAPARTRRAPRSLLCAPWLMGRRTRTDQARRRFHG